MGFLNKLKFEHCLSAYASKGNCRLFPWPQPSDKLEILADFYTWMSRRQEKLNTLATVPPSNPFSILQGVVWSGFHSLNLSGLGIPVPRIKVDKEIPNYSSFPLASTAHCTHPKPFLRRFMVSLVPEPLHTLFFLLFPSKFFFPLAHPHSFSRFQPAVTSEKLKEQLPFLPSSPLAKVNSPPM